MANGDASSKPERTIDARREGNLDNFIHLHRRKNLLAPPLSRVPTKSILKILVHAVDPEPEDIPGGSNSLSVIEHPQSSSNQLEYPLLHNLNRLILDFARAPTVKSLRQLIRSSSGYRAVRTSKAYNPSPLDLISQPVTKAIAGWFYRTNSGTLTFGPKTTRCSARPLAHLLSRIHLGQYGGGPNFSEALAQVIPHPDTKTFEEKNPLPSTRI